MSFPKFNTIGTQKGINKNNLFIILEVLLFIGFLGEGFGVLFEANGTFLARFGPLFGIFKRSFALICRSRSCFHRNLRLFGCLFSLGIIWLFGRLNFFYLFFCCFVFLFFKYYITYIPPSISSF